MTKPSAHDLFSPRVAAPFLLVALIWGSTWWVITGQIGDVPASWSVTWRFLLAMPCMFVLALIYRKPINIGRSGHAAAICVGLTQFCFNFNFVYRAEAHLTSGIVAVMFGMLIVPNAILGRIVLGQQMTARFLLGGVLAIGGIAMLLTHEAQLSPLGGNITLGIALAIGGILSASIANVMQANRTGMAVPLLSLLAWAMLYGVIADFALAWATAGPPVIPTRLDYWAGTAWLALAGSAVTFPLYYAIVREIGPGRAAYNGVFVVIIAMLISTLIEGYEWSLLAGGGAILALVGMVLALQAKNS